MAAGPSQTVDSRLVGEEGGPDVEVGVTPWGSDHRAVVSTFAIEPAPAPTSSPPRRGSSSAASGWRFATCWPAGARAARVGILAGGEGRPRRSPLQTIPIYDASDHLAPMFGTAPLAPGAYRAALLDGDGKVLATSPFWIAEPDAEPSIETTSPRMRRASRCGCDGATRPANKLDWVGIFPAGDPSLYGYAGFIYTGARPTVARVHPRRHRPPRTRPLRGPADARRRLLGARRGAVRDQ